MCLKRARKNERSRKRTSAKRSTERHGETSESVGGFKGGWDVFGEGKLRLLIKEGAQYLALRGTLKALITA